MSSLLPNNCSCSLQVCPISFHCLAVGFCPQHTQNEPPLPYPPLALSSLSVGLPVVPPTHGAAAPYRPIQGTRSWVWWHHGWFLCFGRHLPPHQKIERCAHLCPSVSCWDAGEGGGRGGACARGTFLHQFGQQFEGQKEDKIEYTLALDSQLYTTAYTTTNQKQASVMEKSMERMRHQEGDQSIKKTKQNC